MAVLAVLGLLLLLVAAALLHLALRPGEVSGVGRSLAMLQAMTEAPGELRAEAEQPFADRVLAPMRARALRIGRRLTGADYAERVRHRLDLAGNPAGLSVDRIVSGKVICALAGLIVAVMVTLLLGPALLTGVLVALLGLVAGFFAPDLYLYQKAYDRAEQLRRGLPDAIDLMTISVEAGLGFDAAVQQVARHTTGPLAEELARMLREMQLGKSRSEALRGLADRSRIEEVTSFVGAMVQADSLGIPIAQVLRVQSGEQRVRRRQAAERRAQQVPVKITIPLVFCILPCLFVIILGPAALQIMDHF